MVDKKITQLVELVTPTSGDLLPIVDVSGISTTKKITYGNFESGISHQNISGIGTNTHLQIDSHISSTNNPHSLIIDSLNDVNAPTPSKNKVLKWNGGSWVPADYDETFTFSCTSFDDGLATGILAGSNEWKGVDEINFIANYNNGPPTSANIKLSINGGTYNTIGSMNSPDYISGTNYSGINYPSPDQYLRFRLDSTDGEDSDIDYASSLYFYNYIFYGDSSKGSSFSESDVEKLNSTISNSYTSSRTINAGTGSYVVWAYPSRYTSIHGSGARFNNVTMPFNTETVSITNMSGLTEDYKVFASTDTGLGNSTLTLSTSEQLINPLYYGITEKTSGFTEADIEGLTNSEITNDNTQVWDAVTAGVDEYLLFSFPKRLGTVSFWVGGFEGGFEDSETVSVTNVNGFTEDYYAWRSSNDNLGETTVETK